MNLYFEIQRRGKIPGLVMIAAIARKKFLPAAIALMALAGAGNATAGMCTLPGGETISLGPVNVPSSAAIGDTVAITTMNLPISCPTPNSSAGYQIGFVTSPSWPTSSIADLWPTNVTGIGVRLTSTSNSPITGTTAMVVSGNATRTCTATVKPGTSLCLLAPDQVTPSGFTLNINIKVEFVKTANSIGSQTLSAYLVGPFAWDVGNNDHNTASAHQVAGSGTGPTFVAATCSRISDNPLVVELPSLPASQLSSPGMTGGAKDFSLDFTCSGTSKNVKMTMSDIRTDGTAKDTLTLSPGLGSATGVQLQVLYNNTPITFNPDSQATGIPVGSSPGGGAPFSIPLTVQYVSTGAVTPGSVNAAATFTLNYQ
jgi:type 1 fimbria pilin